MLKMCLNWRVMVALAATGVLIYVVAPNLVAAALPFLMLAICPLSMLFMMRSMGHGAGGGQCDGHGEPSPKTNAANLTREQQVAELKSELSEVQARQAAIADHLAALERDEVPAPNDSPAMIRP